MSTDIPGLTKYSGNSFEDVVAFFEEEGINYEIEHGPKTANGYFRTSSIFMYGSDKMNDLRSLREEFGGDYHHGPVGQSHYSTYDVDWDRVDPSMRGRSFKIREGRLVERVIIMWQDENSK